MKPEHTLERHQDQKSNDQHVDVEGNFQGLLPTGDSTMSQISVQDQGAQTVNLCFLRVSSDTSRWSGMLEGIVYSRFQGIIVIAPNDSHRSPLGASMATAINYFAFSFVLVYFI